MRAELKKRVEDLVEPVWERQSWEGWKAFRAWCKFRDIAQHHTLERVFQAIADEEGLQARTIRDYSSVYLWRERLAAYEAHLDAIRLEERERLERGDARLQYDRRRQVAGFEWELATALHKRALEMLTVPLVEMTETIEEADGDGRPVQITRIYQPGPWKMGDAQRFGKTASDLMRRAAEMAGDRSQVEVIQYSEEDYTRAVAAMNPADRASFIGGSPRERNEILGRYLARVTRLDGPGSGSGD